jgi:hypothetical protein
MKKTLIGMREALDIAIADRKAYVDHGTFGRGRIIERFRGSDSEFIVSFKSAFAKMELRMKQIVIL